MKFKFNDKVRVTQEGFYEGCTGRVKSYAKFDVSPTKQICYDVDFKGQQAQFWQHELELFVKPRPKPTPTPSKVR